MNEIFLQVFRLHSIAVGLNGLYALARPARHTTPPAKSGPESTWRLSLAAGFILLLASPAVRANEPLTPAVQVLNQGQVILEGAPPIPPGLGEEIGPYQETRFSLFSGFTGNGGIYIKTRSGGVNQLYAVEHPGATRMQVSSTREAIGEVERQPGGELLAFTMSQEGDGFDQIYLLNPEQGESQRLTDGASLNNRMVWDEAGRRLAWRSTRRNGEQNDIWLMDIDAPESIQLALKAPDGALWKPVAFGRGGDTLLVQRHASITDSSIYLLRLDAGQLQPLTGSPENPSSNIATGFSSDGKWVHFITNQRNGAAELGRIPLDGAAPISYVPGDLPWDVTEFEMSTDGNRGAFVTNEEGISRLYLFDPLKQKYKRVKRTPMGSISGLEFSPDGRRLGMTISTAQTPNDAFVLDLGRRPLSHRKLERWTYSDVGGLDTSSFVEPELIHFPAPMITDERQLALPAFYYRPQGARPPYPVIIHVHGGPEGQFRPLFNSTIQLWLDRLGAAVIAPNVRGSLGYGAAYLAMDDGMLRENAVADIGALLDWIRENPDLDEDRVAVVGASYGGYMALASAVHYSNRLSAAIDRAGISHFVTYLENTQDYRRELRRAEYGDERDPEMRAFLQRISPLENAHRIEIPLFIAQGRNDPVVPESESVQMVQALRQQGKTVWYMNALNEGHNYLRKENSDLYEQVSFLFLRKHLVGAD